MQGTDPAVRTVDEDRAEFLNRRGVASSEDVVGFGSVAEEPFRAALFSTNEELHFVVIWYRRYGERVALQWGDRVTGEEDMLSGLPAHPRILDGDPSDIARKRCEGGTVSPQRVILG